MTNLSVSPEANSQLKQFLDSDFHRVFVLKGPRGAGKSFFLREEFLKNEEALARFHAVAFTSVFGVQSVQQLVETAMGSLTYKKLGFLTGKSLRSGMGLFGWGEAAKSSISLLWTVATRKGLLLVIDDIDRLGEELHLETLLGFANTLAENSQGATKVIVVLDDNYLSEDEKEIWEGLREKFIDVEFAFRPMVSELVGKFVETKDLQEVIEMMHVNDSSPNIRTMLKVEEMTLTATRVLESKGILLTDEEKCGIAKLAFLFMRAGKEYSVAHLKEAATENGYMRILREEENQAKTIGELERSMDAPLSRNPLARICIKYFNDGSVGDSEFEELRSHLKTLQEREALQKAEREFWGTFNRNFKTGEEEFVQAAMNFVELHVNEIGLDRMTTICDRVKDLGRSTKEIWGLWLKGNTVPPAYKQEMKDRIPEELHYLLTSDEGKGDVTGSPEELLKAVMTERSFGSAANVSALAKWSSAMWKQWFEECEEEWLLLSLRSFLHVGFDETDKLRGIQDCIRSTLTEIGNECVFRRQQMENMLRDLVSFEVDAVK